MKAPRGGWIALVDQFDRTIVIEHEIVSRGEDLSVKAEQLKRRNQRALCSHSRVYYAEGDRPIISTDWLLRTRVA